MTTFPIYHELSSHTTRQPMAYLQVDDPLLTFKEAMSYLRVSRSTLYRLMDRGELSSYKVGNSYRFRKSDLTATPRRQMFTQSA